VVGGSIGFLSVESVVRSLSEKIFSSADTGG